MMEQKKISVIMGVYNCAKTLPEAINSILAQTYANWELIMCDDCSTDNTYEVAKAYADKYPDKIILLQNEVNSKLSYSLNHCLKHATGEFIARMDGDDISLPERFEKQMKYLKEHPEYDLVGTAMQRFSEKGEADIIYAVPDPDYYTPRRRVPFYHATILAHRRVFDRLNGYTVCERTMRGQDYDLWFRFYHAGFQGNNIREALYMVREDINAIKRRTFKVRWNAFKTACIGFRLLGYPKRWLIRPFCNMILKSLVPYRIILIFRKFQSYRFGKMQKEG